jgi:CheY-like chemotaxis protein
MLGIVRSLNGALQVQSSPDWGTLFRVFLPASKAPGTAPEAERPPATAPAPEERSILIVDDEPAVREAAADILQLAGYAILVADDGPSGLTLFQRQRGDIGLVLVDMKMPGMNGLEVMEAIRQQAPNVPIILSTGYSEHMVDQATGARRPDGFLHKPYDSQSLLSAVQRALQAGPDRVTP